MGLPNYTIKNNERNTFTFGFEATILLEVWLPTIQNEAYDNDHNIKVLAQDLDLDLDLDEETRELTLIQMARYQK